MEESALSTCLGCGCTCDDIDVSTREGTIVEARNACPLGVAWFGSGSVPNRVLVDGHAASSEDAIEAAARLLVESRRPLVYFAPDLTCEAQREAIAVADVLRASLDSVTSATAMGSVLAAQEQGRATATVGEIRNRADVLVFWGVDPALRYPRYWSRYAPEPAGVHVPNGRRSRKVVAVDVGEAHGPADADVRLAVAPDEEVGVLTALKAGIGDQGSGIGYRARARSPFPDPRSPTPPDVWMRAEQLARAIDGGRYVVFVADAEPQEGRDPGRAAALIGLTQALNGPTRCALSMLRAGGNRSGADACLTSQTGFPAAIDFSRGYPRYRPFDADAATLLARSDVDAVLVAGSVASIPPDLVAAMARVAHVVVGPRASDSPLAAGRAAIDTGIAGIHERGTALRMDDVPLPVRKCVDGPVNALSVIQALHHRISSRRRAPRGPLRVASRKE